MERRALSERSSRDAFRRTLTALSIPSLPSFPSPLSSRLQVYAALDARMKARYSSKKACFTAAYTVALLHDVYGFDLQSERTPIVFSDTLNGFEGSWALGAWVAATIEKIST